MAAQQIAELYGSVGFRIDQKSWDTLNKFERKIDNIQKKLARGFQGSINLSGITGGGSGGGSSILDNLLVPAASGAGAGALAGGGRRGTTGGRGRSRVGAMGSARSTNPIDGPLNNLAIAGSAFSNLHTLGMVLTGGILTTAGKSIVEVTSKYEGLRASLLASTGDAESANKQFEFLEKTSKRLGLVTTEIAKPYVNFAIAAKAAGMTAEESDEMYTGFAEASRALNLSADDTAGIFRALGQMFSKNTVQSEELKGQLGERLPGAFTVAAEAMEMNTEELTKQLKAGKVFAKDLVPKLSEAYQKLVKDSGALSLSLKSTGFMTNRMTEEWNRMLERLGKGGVGDALRELMLTFTQMFESAKSDGTFFTHMLETTFRLTKALAGSIDVVMDSFNALYELIGPRGLATIAAFSSALILLSKSGGRVSKAFKGALGLGILVTTLEDLNSYLDGKESLIGKLEKYLFGEITVPFKDAQTSGFVEDMKKMGGWLWDTVTEGYFDKERNPLGYSSSTKKGYRPPVFSYHPPNNSKPPTNVYISNVALPNVTDGVSLVDDLNKFIGTQVPFRQE